MDLISDVRRHISVVFFVRLLRIAFFLLSLSPSSSLSLFRSIQYIIIFYSDFCPHHRKESGREKRNKFLVLRRVQCVLGLRFREPMRADAQTCCSLLFDYSHNGITKIDSCRDSFYFFLYSFYLFRTLFSIQQYLV